MKIRIRLFISLVVVCVLSAWTINETSDFEKTEWLIGTWEYKTTKGSIYEVWNKTNDNELSGKSYVLKDKDTVVLENLRLVQEHDKLFYIPLVKNQNNGLPVRFLATKVLAAQLVFENPKHDFPQKISYTKLKSDSLVAEISGMRHGQLSKQTFLMGRVK